MEKKKVVGLVFVIISVSMYVLLWIKGWRYFEARFGSFIGYLFFVILYNIIGIVGLYLLGIGRGKSRK